MYSPSSIKEGSAVQQLFHRIICRWVDSGCEDTRHEGVDDEMVPVWPVSSPASLPVL